jgi:hypothetical protein
MRNFYANWEDTFPTSFASRKTYSSFPVPLSISCW